MRMHLFFSETIEEKEGRAKYMLKNENKALWWEEDDRSTLL